MNEWNSLIAASAVASATLTGLLYVGVSINLSKILALPLLPGRVLISMILQVTILIVSIYKSSDGPLDFTGRNPPLIKKANQ